MKNSRKILPFLLLLLFFTSCITQFLPQTNEDKEIIVIEGLITNKPGPNTIKLSKSLPLGGASAAKPLGGCSVSVTDNLSDSYSFTETTEGTYVSDSANFQGVIGRIYTLHILTNTSDNATRFDSYPVEMKPVPAIDSLYYVKQNIKESAEGDPLQQGCTVYLNTHDPSNSTKFYRWEYTETWEFQIPFSVPNNICYVTAGSDVINIKNTSSLGEDRVESYPVKFISNTSDRLNMGYSILVNQFSLSEDEYSYWEKLQNLSEQVGGLYDIVPSSIPSNVYCIDNPDAKVLGYFSVSACSSKRIFIKEYFAGLVDLYTNCADAKAPIGPVIPNLGVTVWIIGSHGPMDPYWILTYDKGCADCTVRGSTTPPDFWPTGK
jgi:hypothetical protein